MPERLQHLPLHLQIGAEVAVGGSDADVTQIITDDGQVDAGLKEGDRTTVSKRVGSDPALMQVWNGLSGTRAVLGEQVANSVAGEWRTPSATEDHGRRFVVWVMAIEQDLEGLSCLRP
jgi:hypothetical protein